jgi:hypothetical protein
VGGIHPLGRVTLKSKTTLITLALESKLTITQYVLKPPHLSPDTYWHKRNGGFEDFEN